MNVSELLSVTATSVILQKIAPAPSPVSPSASWDEWVPGMPNENYSPPLNYSMEGFLLGVIARGKSIRMLRTHRNGIKCIGIFTSTPVVGIRENQIETFNSLYTITLGNQTRKEAL